ncbi:fructosamine kinase family protein [Ornithinimicrobium sp. F0845]|uniref:fructosamine kinase family protein n=1 Tax=Ornithinimicrobium sp. F0845 TaxID=2926412 RepID=UPI001FF6DD56|nr:fructosamine kinase family protein [Ornithinimicrobium sp. F0845]MCK0112262.1 fructosamine kinase family protein [Ornithinimicrobium sp. F0845]
MDDGTLPADLVAGLDVQRATPVSGGDIAHAYRLETPDGPLFAKTHPTPSPGMFEREAAGLRALREHTPAELGVPEVLRESCRGLVLEWVDEGSMPSGRTEVALGAALAHLHGAGSRTGRTHYGGLEGDADGATHGYLGSGAVDLTPTQDWPEFYLHRRLEPLVIRAAGEGRLDPAAIGILSELEPRAAELCGPISHPALLHGDLWAGNRLVDTDGRNWLIDPACFWGHPEVDLAMMQLFGGFGPECLDAYQDVSPLADGWRDRVAWYQLAPLLVHAILFGGGYGAAALRALSRYR